MRNECRIRNCVGRISDRRYQGKKKVSQRCDMHRNGWTSSKRECATYKITITKGLFFLFFFFTKNLLRFTERILLVEFYLDFPWCAHLLLFLEWIRLFSSFSIIKQYNGTRSQKTSTSYYYYVLLLEHKHVKTLSSNQQLLGINELDLFKSSREWKSRKRDSPSRDLWTEWLRTRSVLVYVCVSQARAAGPRQRERERIWPTTTAKLK